MEQQCAHTHTLQHNEYFAACVSCHWVPYTYMHEIRHTLLLRMEISAISAHTLVIYCTHVNCVIVNGSVLIWSAQYKHHTIVCVCVCEFVRARAHTTRTHARAYIVLCALLTVRYRRRRGTCVSSTRIMGTCISECTAVARDRRVFVYSKKLGQCQRECVETFFFSFVFGFVSTVFSCRAFGV